MANAPEIVAQNKKLVGDEAVQNAGVTVEPEVTEEQVAAQVAPAREKESAKVNVHETVVHTDKVITDPNSPEAVQVPDAGRGSLDLPAHALGSGHVEDRLAEASKSNDAAATDKS